MARYTLPRYFVRHHAAPDADAADPKVAPLHLIDGFFVGNRHLEAREWIVAVDELGNLRAMRAENRQSLASFLQNELAFNEISRNRQARLVEGNEVFLFNLQLVEQSAGAPGWNDPVYLYGTLFGPLPANSDDQTAGVKGQLTVTRGDLLDGLVQSSGDAFRYGGSSGIGGGFSRCFHLMLPGATDEEIRRGAGIVLAYPLFPAELLAGAANEIVVSQLLYDLLSALKEDLETEQIAHPLRSMVLPVVNRFALEQELKSQGYRVNGDTAFKETDSGEGFKGFLASVFGALRNDDLTLPPEGETDDFLRIARQTLEHLENSFPSPRIVALRNCLKTAPAHRQVQSPLTPTPPIKTPRQNLTPPTPLQAERVTVQKTAAPENEPPAWMRDFIHAHRKEDEPPPKLTSTSKTEPPIISWAKNISETPKQRRRLEWEKDFKQPAETESENRDEKEQSPIEPDWMKDFE
jgi:hypothetical protein